VAPVSWSARVRRGDRVGDRAARRHRRRAGVTATVSMLLRIVIEWRRWRVLFWASVTLAVKLEVPARVGVPDTTPVEVFSVRPDGSDPELIDQA